MVTPYAGVWIEIEMTDIQEKLNVSLPTRECGLKLEILRQISISEMVTPYAGVWIEIYITWLNINTNASLPTRECGLK